MIIIRVDLAARFLKELERLSRKYPRAIDEVDLLVNQLKQGQQSGDKIPGVGYEVYKVRLKIPSAGRGSVVVFGLFITFISQITLSSSPFIPNRNKKI